MYVKLLQVHTAIYLELIGFRTAQPVNNPHGRRITQKQQLVVDDTRRRADDISLDLERQQRARKLIRRSERGIPMGIDSSIASTIENINSIDRSRKHVSLWWCPRARARVCVWVERERVV